MLPYCFLCVGARKYHTVRWHLLPEPPRAQQQRQGGRTHPPLPIPTGLLNEQPAQLQPTPSPLCTLAHGTCVAPASCFPENDS